MTRRHAVPALVALLLLVVAFRLPEWSARALERKLGAHFGRQVTIGAVRWRLLPLEAEIHDLRIAGATPGAPPFAEIPRLTVVPALRPLSEGRLSLRRLRLERPVVRANTDPEGADDIPQLAGVGGPEGGIEIRRLIVDGGALLLDDERIPLDLDLPALRARLATRPTGELAGDIAFGPGPVRFGDAPPLPVEASARIGFVKGVLTIESGHARAEGADLDFSGRVTVGSRPGAQLSLRGTVPLELADRHVLRSDLGLGGSASYQGGARIQDGRLTLSGRIEGTGGRFDGLVVPRFAGQLAWDVAGLRLRGLDVSAMGGTAKLDVTVPPTGPSRVAGWVDGVDAESLARYLLEAGPLGLGATATGAIDVSWPRGTPARLSGTADLQLTARTQEGRTPVAGQLAWRAAEGRQTIRRSVFDTPVGRVAVSGDIGLSGDVSLALEADTGDIEAAEALTLRLRRAFGGKQLAAVGVTGEGRFRGTWRGTLDAPVFEGRFEGARIRYAGIDWGTADWTGVAQADEVRSQPLVLRRADAELRLEGTVGTLGTDPRVDIRATLRGWPADELQRAAGVAVAVNGRVTGDVTLGGQRSRPTGRARLRMPEARRGAQVVQDLDVDLLLHPDRFEVVSARGRAGGGKVEVTGHVFHAGAWDLRAAVEDVDLGALLPDPASGIAWGGRIGGTVHLSGTRAAPLAEARFQSPRVFLGDEGVGALELTFAAVDQQPGRLSARLRSARVDVEAEGRITIGGEHRGSVTVRARETSLDPFLRVFAPSLPARVGLVASGALTIEGPFADPAALTATATMPVLEVRLPEYPIRSSAPVRLTMSGGMVQLVDLRLEGEGTDVRVSGRIGTTGARSLDLDLRGDADLRALAAVTGELRGQGAARLAMTVTGPALDPRVDGTLDLARAGVRVRGFPHGIDSLTGRVQFSERAARFADVTGTVGAGQVSLEGQASYTLGRLLSFEVAATGRRMALRYPEGLRSVVDADLRFFGDPRRQWATGRIDVHQALWTRRYDLATELLATRTAWEQRASLQEGVNLDVVVRAPGTLRIDNNLTTLSARADLKLQGTWEAPVVLGRAEVERGRVYFQGNTYVIRRGTIDFVNPQRIDPLFDIEAETRLRSYRVTLKVNGTLDRVYPALTSDPPLNAVQIVSLLAGGDESSVASLAVASGVGASGANLAATGAASLAAGRISEQMGLERGAERLLGLNRFSIDPSLVRGGVQNPTARLTVGKRVTSDLNVLYSVDLRGTDERLLSVEYTLSDRLSVLMTRAEPGGFGFDLRLRQAR